MLEFRNGPRPRNYLARGEQVRLFVMIAALMGIIWVAVEARNPQHYRWIWDWGREKSAANVEVDTRFAPSASTADDTFVFRPPGEDGDEAGQAVGGPLTEADLAAIRDDEPFRAGEGGAWFKLFDRLRKTDSAALSEESVGPVTFIQLYRQPKEYRAALVTLAGTLHGSEQIAAPRNELGIESYYRTWLSPRDNPANPIVIYTLTVPEGFPQGMAIEEQVELDGFFFKRWPYAAQDTVRSAPVVLAKTLRRVTSQAETPALPMSLVTIVGTAAAAALAFVAIVWWRTRRTRRREPAADLFDGQSLASSISDGAGRLKVLTDPDMEVDTR